MLASESHTAYAENKKVSIRLDWFPAAQHAGYYIAKAKGYYNEAGLDVDIVTGAGSIQVVQQVAAGNNTFGNAYGLAVISGRAAGANVKAVANYSPDAQACISVRADAGIAGPKDLKGKVVGAATGSPFGAFLPIIWKHEGMSDKDVTVQAVTPASGVPELVRKRIDGWVGSAWQEQLVMEMNFHTKGTCLLYSDYGAGFMGPSIIATDDLIKSDPALVKSFVEASIKGWRYAFAHPKEAGEAVGAASSGVQGVDPPAAIEAAQPILKSGVTHESTKGMAYGAMTAADWQETTDKMVERLGLQSPPKAEDLFTNDFVPADGPLE